MHILFIFSLAPGWSLKKNRLYNNNVAHIAPEQTFQGSWKINNANDGNKY